MQNEVAVSIVEATIIELAAEEAEKEAIWEAEKVEREEVERLT